MYLIVIESEYKNPPKIIAELVNGLGHVNTELPMPGTENSLISGAEIARYLGVNTSNINLTLARLDESIEK